MEDRNYEKNAKKRSKVSLEAQWVLIPVTAISLPVMISVCMTAAALHNRFGTSSFDMGLFVQMLLPLLFLPFATQKLHRSLRNAKIRIVIYKNPAYHVLSCNAAGSGV